MLTMTLIRASVLVGSIFLLLVDPVKSARALAVPTVADILENAIRNLQEAAFTESYRKYICMMNPRLCTEHKMTIKGGHLKLLNVLQKTIKEDATMRPANSEFNGIFIVDI